MQRWANAASYAVAISSAQKGVKALTAAAKLRCGLGGAGKGTSGVINTVKPNTLSELNSDLISKGFQLKGTSGGGYTTYKHPDGRIVTIKPTGEVIPTKPKIAENGKKYNERTDYEFNRLEDQSHSTNHFINKGK